MAVAAHTRPSGPRDRLSHLCAHSAAAGPPMLSGAGVPSCRAGLPGFTSRLSWCRPTVGGALWVGVHDLALSRFLRIELLSFPNAPV